MQLIAILITPAPSLHADILSSVYVDPGQSPETIEFPYKKPLDALRDGWRLLNAPTGDARGVTWWLVRDAIILLPADAQTAKIQWDQALDNTLPFNRPDPPQATIRASYDTQIWAWDAAPNEIRKALPLPGTLVLFVSNGDPIPEEIDQSKIEASAPIAGGVAYSLE